VFSASPQRCRSMSVRRRSGDLQATTTTRDPPSSVERGASAQARRAPARPGSSSPSVGAEVARVASRLAEEQRQCSIDVMFIWGGWSSSSGGGGATPSSSSAPLNHHLVPLSRSAFLHPRVTLPLLCPAVQRSVGKEGRWVLDGSLWRKVGGAWESWDLPPLLTSPAVGPHTAKPRDRAPQKRRRRLGTDDKREERCRAQRKAHPRSPWRWRPVEQRLICIVPYICLRLLQRKRMVHRV
jgi:hypothetical protein